MSEVIISAQKRDNAGTSISRYLRRNGRVPAVIYGAENDAVSVSVDKLELGRLLRSDFSVITIDVDGQKEMAVIKEVQVHPLRSDVLHVDFMRVAAGHEIKVTVPINYVGESVGVKLGGLLSIMKNELNIQVLPKNMPDTVEVDITDMEIGDVVRVGDLDLKDVTVLDDPAVMLCQVHVTRKAAETLSGEEEEEGEAESSEATEEG